MVFCVDAEAYRVQVAALGLTEIAYAVNAADPGVARRAALVMKLGLLDQPIVPPVLDPLLDAWRALVETTGALTVVRSSALVEDRFGSSFAGQFESYLGLENESDFLTAVRSCWAALWSTRVLRYMATHDASPADTAMAVLVQPLVSARVAGGGLSRTSDGDMVLNATWGLGSAIAQGEVVPDRIVLSREGVLRDTVAGRIFHRVGCAHGAPATRRPRSTEPCLNVAQAVELGRLLRQAEDIMGVPVEIEWAHDDAGFKLLQARPPARGAGAGPRRNMAAPPGAQRPSRRRRLGIRTRVRRELRMRAPARRARRHPRHQGRGARAQHRAPARGRRGSRARRQYLAPRLARPASEASRWCWACSMQRSAFPMALQVAVDGVAGVVRWMPQGT